MELVYSRERRTMKEGQSFRNPRFFNGAEEGVTKVLLDGDYPAISRAYAAAGVEVLRTDPLEVAGPKGAALPPHEPGAIVIPENWRDLPWTQRTADDVSLRKLASAISDAPITNKTDAIAAVEAELERRAGETVEGTVEERADDRHPGEQVGAE